MFTNTKKTLVSPSASASCLLGLALVLGSAPALSADGQTGSRGHRTVTSQPHYLTPDGFQVSTAKAIFNRRGQRTAIPGADYPPQVLTQLVAGDLTPDRRGQRID